MPETPAKSSSKQSGALEVAALSLEQHLQQRYSRFGTLNELLQWFVISLVAGSIVFFRLFSQSDRTLAILLVTFASLFFVFWYYIFPRYQKVRATTKNFAEYLVDIILVAFFVHITGGIESFFIVLYYLLIVGAPNRTSIQHALALNIVIALLIAIHALISASIVEMSELLPLFGAQLGTAGLLAVVSLTVHSEIRRTYGTYYRQLGEYEKLKEIDRLKDEFVFIASHELRSPITALRGYASMLEEGDFGKIPDEAKEGLHRIWENADRLNTLVDDLLNVARLEARRIPLDIVEFDAIVSAGEVIESLRVRAREKGVHLVFHPETKPLLLKADKHSFAEIVTNLVDNAIKYTPPGGTVRVTTKGNTFAVADDGYGIPKKDQERIFEKFFRVHRRGVEDPGGTGLGLFIVRNLCEILGGKIRFVSEEGHGTTFFFQLPRGGTSPR